MDNSEDNFNLDMKIEEVVTTLGVEETTIRSSHQEKNPKKKIPGHLNPLKKINGQRQIKKLKKMHGVNQILKMKIATGTPK